MEKIEFECPDCGEKNKLILMGYDRAKFDKKCQNCKADLEILKKSDEISVESKKKVVKKETAIPSDYKKYKPEESNEKTAVFIAILILTSSLMGVSTGWSLSNAFNVDYSDYEKVNLEIVVLNNTSNLEENVTIVFNNEEMNYTYNENGIYNILVNPGKYTAIVTAPEHKNATMEFFVPPQDSNLRLPDTNEGIEGINRFTFVMEKGNGDITFEENIYIKVFTWCPLLVYLFSLIGIWGSLVTYKRQSYKNAQIGAFFSVMAMGFLIIGPILGIIALYYLKKHKKIFTASFKN
mgnify:CR=1 FL=1